MDTFELAATVVAGTALVLAPIDPQPIRDLNTPIPDPTPESEPIGFDQELIGRVRTALGVKHWRPNAEGGETETRISMWSQLELNDLYERVGGAVTTRQVAYGDRTEEEITVTIDVPGIGPVEAVTDWYEGLAKYGARDELPLMLALS